MKLISWNVNGIRAVHKKGLFIPLVKLHDPEIILLQETKALQGQNEMDLSDYEEYWNSAKRPGYSGTAIFVKKSFKQKVLSVSLNIPEKIAKKYQLADDDYGDPNTEGRVITLEFKDFYAISVYTPNAKDDLSRLKLRHDKWDKAFLGFMKELKKKKPVIFGGDLNVAHTEDDLARPKENVGKKGFTKEERVGVDQMIKSGFVDTLRIFTKGNGYYTWWSHFANARARNIGWRIDYFFVSAKLTNKVKDSKILADAFGSDHCPILLEINL